MVAPGRFELPTSGLGNRCSIHLSYGATLHNVRIINGLAGICHLSRGVVETRLRRIGFYTAALLIFQLLDGGGIRFPLRSYVSYRICSLEVRRLGGIANLRFDWWPWDVIWSF